MYRPKGWDKYYKPVDVYMWVKKDTDRGFFEAGADAILKSLILEGKYTDGKAPTLSINVPPEEKGWLVFIPDKEKSECSETS